MGLPLELVPYAENFYRRFPEEFIALGMPGLEEAFDLRPNGTWSRRVLETPTEKTVEITIRRWQMPSLVWDTAVAPTQPSLAAMSAGYHQQQAPIPLHLHQHPQAAWGASGAAAAQGAPTAQGGLCSPYGAVGTGQGPYSCLGGSCSSPFLSSMLGAPAAAEWQAAAAATAAATTAADEQAGGRLARLESALSLLKPQIEALLSAQVRQPQCQAYGGQCQVPVPAALAASFAVPAAASPPQAAAAQVQRQMQTPPQPYAVQPYAAQPQPYAAQPQSYGAPPQQQSIQQHVTAQLQHPQPVAAGFVAHGDAQTAAAAAAAAATSPPPAAAAAGASAAGDKEEANELRTRRHMVPLQIQTSPKDKAVEKDKGKKTAEVQVVKLHEGDSEANSSNNVRANASGGTKDASAEDAKATGAAAHNNNPAQRPRVNINAVRVAPSAVDPASPRSPGRYSAWKS